MPMQPHRCSVLDRSLYPHLAATLGDTPETAISQHHLHQGNCSVYLTGTPEAFDAVIIQADTLPGEPVGYGSDPHAIWQLLRRMQGWFCIEVSSECAAPLGALIERERDVGVCYLDDLFHVLETPATVWEHDAVRLLIRDDLPLLESAPPELRDSCWGHVETLLTEGIVACAIVKGEVVATALTAACSARYADIGVFTREDHRGHGLATAAASLVARRIQAQGQVPTWSAGAHNAASLRIASKLGFLQVSTKRYVILAD